MRAREFTINVPINVRINGDDEVEIDTPVDQESPEEEEEATMVPPLQQAIELQKATLGKESEVIDDLTDEDEVDEEDPEQEPDEHAMMWKNNQNMW